MPSLLIIEKDIENLDYLLSLFHEWQSELDILTARDEIYAVNLLKQQQVNIVLCSTSLLDDKGQIALSRLAEQFPTVPFIAVVPANQDADHADMAPPGAAFYHARPINTALLFEQINDLVHEGSIVNYNDIPTHSLLQLLETEEKTCTIKVYGINEIGFIYLLKGIPLAAETNLMQGENSFFEIINWDDVVLERMYFNSQRQQNLFKPLVALIMEGFRVKDKYGSSEAVPPIMKREQGQGQLRKISTGGQKLSLDIGSKLKLEFSQLEGSFDCITVGMLPENYLIVTSPEQFRTLSDEQQKSCHVMVKYVHSGKLCLFKATILSIPAKPPDLLFLDYPAAIHYRELRKNKRRKIYIPCTINLGDGQEYFGALIDLSSSGSLCEIKKGGGAQLPSIHIDQQLELQCLLPGMKEEQKINALVRNINQDSSELRFGIEFYNLHSYLIETINRYFFSVDN